MGRWPGSEAPGMACQCLYAGVLPVRGGSRHRGGSWNEQNIWRACSLRELRGEGLAAGRPGAEVVWVWPKACSRGREGRFGKEIVDANTRKIY